MKYIVTSDIHLGHLKTPTEHIIKSFIDNILTEKNKDIDVLFIGGDLFDRLLDLNSKEVHKIIEFFNYLLSYCINYNILLRVLEGTPSHDWQQSHTLIKLNELKNNKCNIKYFKELDIEYMSEFNKYILYIPDEWANTHEEIEAQIEKKLLENNINKVDIAILHGQFRYQVGNKKFKGLCYNEEYFLNLVRGFIHIGHYHMFTSLDRIIANGSLERLAHGEEHEKGYVLVNNNTYTFIENSNAYTYKTLNITNKATIEKLDLIINSYKKGSHIRLMLNKDHQFNSIYNDLKNRYPDYKLKKVIKEHVSEDNTVTYILNEDEIEFSDKFVLDGNVQELLLNIINSKYSLSEVENSKLLKYVSIFKEEELNASVS